MFEMAHTTVQTNRWQAAKTMQIYTAIHTNTHTHACVHRQVQLAIESAHLHLLLIFADNKVVSFESLESLCPLLLAGAEDCDLRHKQKRRTQPGPQDRSRRAVMLQDSRLTQPAMHHCQIRAMLF